MPDGNVMSPEIANAVWDLLVEHAGARETGRDQFVHHHTHRFHSEDRFGGNLGFGGKFWRNSGFRPDGTYGEIWYINTYAEDMTPERRRAIETLDGLLDDLRAQHEAANEASGPTVGD